MPPRGGEESLSGEICAAQALLCPWLFFFFSFEKGCRGREGEWPQLSDIHFGFKNTHNKNKKKHFKRI